jgi:hypothetical protein
MVAVGQKNRPGNRKDLLFPFLDFALFPGDRRHGFIIDGSS